MADKEVYKLIDVMLSIKSDVPSADMWLAPGKFLDASDPNVRRLFFNENLKKIIPPISDREFNRGPLKKA